MNSGLYFIDLKKYLKLPLNELKGKKMMTKFSIWVFVFLLAMTGILAIYVAELAFFVSDKSKIIDSWLNISNGSEDSVSWANVNWNAGLINYVVQVVFVSIIFLSLVVSIYKSFKLKSFRGISMLSTFFVFIQTIYGFVSLFRYLIIGASLVDSFKVSWVYVLDFIMNFVYLFVWFFISRNVAVIRRIYFFAEMSQAPFGQVNDLFGDPNKDQNNPFVGNMGSQQGNNYNTNDSFYLRLKNLSRDQLDELAKQLSISGYESMSNEELIQIISNIRSTQESNSVEREVTPIKDNDEDKENKNTN